MFVAPTESEMIDEAIRLSNDNRVQNVRWLHGKAEDKSNDWGSFRLILIAKAFHWMDRESILEILYKSSDAVIRAITDTRQAFRPILLLLVIPPFIRKPVLYYIEFQTDVLAIIQLSDE